MIKAIVIGVVISVITAVGAWLVNVVEERKILEAQLATAVQTNKTNEEQIAKLRQLNKQKEDQIAKREITERKNKDKLNQLTKQVRDLKNEPAKITVVERECMESAIPVPVLDLLREPAQGTYRRNKDREGMSRYPTLLAVTDPSLYRFDVGGRSDLHLGVESLYPHPFERQSNYQ